MPKIGRKIHETKSWNCFKLTECVFSSTSLSILGGQRDDGGLTIGWKDRPMITTMGMMMSFDYKNSMYAIEPMNTITIISIILLRRAISNYFAPKIVMKTINFEHYVALQEKS